MGAFSRPRAQMYSRGRLVGLVACAVLIGIATACSKSAAPDPGTRTRGMPDASEEITSGGATGQATQPVDLSQVPRAVDTPQTAPAPEENAATSRSEVAVTLEDYRIRMPQSLPAGPTAFRVMNTGQHQHSLEIVGETLERRLDSPLNPGESRSLTIDLKQGSYKVYCPVGTHADMGMSLVLNVTDGAAPGTKE